ncbi:unnamed protein product, partial [Laminaria digitata]
MPCAAGELCMIPNLTPEPPDGHRCRGGCGGRLHGVCGQVVDDESDTDNPLRRICPTCSTTAAGGDDDDVSRTIIKGKRKAGAKQAKQRARGAGQLHPQPNDGSKSSRTQLTLGQKLEMLELLTQKMSHAELARRYKCSARTVSNVAQKREELEAEASRLSSSSPPPASATAAARRATSDRGRGNGASPATTGRRKRGVASTTAREAQQAISSAAGMPCAAGELCMVPSLTPGPPYGQPCPGGCGGQLHDVCGEVVEVEADEEEEEEDQSNGDKNSSSSHRVCPTCAATAKIPAAAVAAAAAAVAAAAAAAARDDNVSRTSAGSKRKAAGDARGGSGPGEHQDNLQSKLLKPSADTTSKSRTQLTLGQKLEMLKLLTQKVSHRELARRFKCAARTVSNVAQNRAALEAEGASSSGGRSGSSTRKRSAAFPEVDKRVMAVINASRKYKTPITRARITALGLAAKKALLSTTNPASPPITTATTNSTAEERRKRLESFGASEKWAKSFVSRNGLAGRVIRGAGSGGSGLSGGGGDEAVVGIASASPEVIESGMRKVRKECEKYEPENIFTVDEMSLFYKLLPKRSYLSSLSPAPSPDSASPTTATDTDIAIAAGGRQTARDTKDMGPRDRVSAYVCSNATGSAKVPVSIVAAPKNPRSFRGRACPVKYFSQTSSSSSSRNSSSSSSSSSDGSAWGSAGDDGVMFLEWWAQVFLPYVRRWTRLEVLCLVDACLTPPGDAWLEDPRGQVKVVVYPANCAGKHQPMGWGVIAAAKLHYRRRLVGGRVSTMLAASALRAEAEERGVKAAGAAGLAEGYPPHLLDAAEMLQAAWADVSEETIARSWVKADTLPAMHIPRGDPVSMAQGAAECVQRFREHEDYSGLAELAEVLNALSAAVHRARGRGGSSSDIDADLVEVLSDLDISPGDPADQVAIAAARAWATVEDREDVAEALRLDEQEAILSGTFGD